ncbi:MAG: efflux transporter outer membrane subunit, partial [Giesbergeria sp.]
SLRLVQMRYRQGVASALDLRQAEALVATARVALAQQLRQRALDANALTLLLGKAPEDRLLEATAPVSTALAEVPAGLPSDLLAQRADVRQAEQTLIAANANIGAARAAFFPRISLTASAGTASNALSGLFKDGSWGWSLAPQALLPIFDAGRNQASLESARAAQGIALAQYEKAIQTAFREVADALAGRATLADQVDAQQAQTNAEAERLRLADLRYRNGVASSLELLDAQRSVFSAQQALVQTQLALRQNQVALYKALGGGWSEQAPQKN